jgi:hypothetical protein
LGGRRRRGCSPPLHISRISAHRSLIPCPHHRASVVRRQPRTGRQSLSTRYAATPYIPLASFPDISHIPSAEANAVRNTRS